MVSIAIRNPAVLDEEGSPSEDRKKYMKLIEKLNERDVLYLMHSSELIAENRRRTDAGSGLSIF